MHSFPSLLRAPLALAAMLALAAGAKATPLTYTVVGSEQPVSVDTTVQATASLDPLIGDPTNTTFLAAGTTGATPGGALDVDTGLPGNFDGGTNGISILTGSQATLTTDGTAATITNLGSVTGLPIPNLTAFFVDVADMSLTFDGPLDSALVQTASGEWSWAGTAPVTLDLTLNATLSIPTVGDFGLPAPIPLSAPVPAAAIAGSFRGDETGSEVVLGLDQLSFSSSIDASASTISADIPTVGTLDVSLASLDDLALSGSILAQSSTPVPVPEPGTALLLGAGLVGVATGARRRR